MDTGFFHQDLKSEKITTTQEGRACIEDLPVLAYLVTRLKQGELHDYFQA